MTDLFATLNDRILRKIFSHLYKDVSNLILINKRCCRLIYCVVDSRIEMYLRNFQNSQKMNTLAQENKPFVQFQKDLKTTKFTKLRLLFEFLNNVDANMIYRILSQIPLCQCCTNTHNTHNPHKIRIFKQLYHVFQHNIVYFYRVETLALLVCPTCYCDNLLRMLWWMKELQIDESHFEIANGCLHRTKDEVNEVVQYVKSLELRFTMEGHLYHSFLSSFLPVKTLIQSHQAIVKIFGIYDELLALLLGYLPLHEPRCTETTSLTFYEKLELFFDPNFYKARMHNFDTTLESFKPISIIRLTMTERQFSNFVCLHSEHISHLLHFSSYRYISRICDLNPDKIRKRCKINLSTEQTSEKLYPILLLIGAKRLKERFDYLVRHYGYLTSFYDSVTMLALFDKNQLECLVNHYQLVSSEFEYLSLLKPDQLQTLFTNLGPSWRKRLICRDYHGFLSQYDEWVIRCASLTPDEMVQFFNDANDPTSPLFIPCVETPYLLLE